MQALDLPPFDHKIRQSAANILEIWDELRRKYVVLTPEEWVRQHVVHYLADHLGYPRGLLVLERSRRTPAPHWPAEVVESWDRTYGETVLHFAAVGPTEADAAADSVGA